MQQHLLTQRVTEHMIIGDIVERYPSVIGPLMEAGIHCVGCGAAHNETLREGLLGHGKTEQEMRDLIAALNRTIPQELPLGNMTITDVAATKLAGFIKKGMSLRIRVLNDSELGFRYIFDLDNKPMKNDEVYTVKGASIIIDKETKKYLVGALIDYVDTPHGAGFKIVNPNVIKSAHTK